jgi:hypothetical protein
MSTTPDGIDVLLLWVNSMDASIGGVSNGASRRDVALAGVTVAAAGAGALRAEERRL